MAKQDTGAAKHPAKASSTKESDGKKTEETVQTPLERCTPGTPKAHPKIPKEENSLKNKEVNESEAKQHTPNQPKQRTSMKQHRIPGLVLYISWKIRRAKVCIDFQRFPSSKSSPTNYCTKRVQNGGTRVPTTKAPVFLQKIKPLQNAAPPHLSENTWPSTK